MADEIHEERRPSRTSIGSLAYISCYHMLFLSVFVSIELLPGYDSFKAMPVHATLYSMFGFIELFFGLAFLNGIPCREDDAAVEYVGLLMANWIIASHMAAIIHRIMFICTFLYWLFCIIIVWFCIQSDLISQFPRNVKSKEL
jgi:hypothetical protein